MDEAAEYELNFIKNIIETTGPRLPASPQERQAAMMIKDEFSRITGKEAVVEKFTCAPHAAIGAIPLLGYLLLFVLTPLYFFTPVGTIIFGLFLLAFAMIQIFKYKAWLDFLFPKHPSQNVYSTIEPTGGKVDYTIVLSAHVDSSWNWRLVKRWPKGIWIMIPWGVVSAIIMVLISFFKVLDRFGILTFSGPWLNWIVFAFLPGMVYIALMFSWKEGVPGAMDNLSGIATIAWMGKYYMENPGEIPENSRILLLAAGSEEAALKGSDAFVKRHHDDLLQNAIVINIDSVSDLDHFHVVDGDAWLGVDYDDELCNLAVEAMKHVGVGPSTRVKNPVGGTDAASFTRKGIPSLTLLAQYMDASDYYHTDNDTVDRIEPDALSRMNEVVKRLVMLVGKHHESITRAS